MALTAEELAARQNYIGGSDIPALLGVSEYKNVVDLWMEKTGRVKPEPTSSRAADLGDRLERPLVDMVADLLGGLNVEYDRRVTKGHLSSQADGWLVEPGQVVEAKVHGLFNPRWPGEGWGEEGTDHVPFDVLAQVVFALHVHDASEGYITALLGRGMGHRFYHLSKSESLAEEIVTLADRFWNEHVQADVRPEGTPHLETLQQVDRIETKTEVIPEEYGHRWAALKEQEGLIKAAMKDLRVDVLDAMGDATFGDTGWGVFSYKADKNGKRTFRYKELT